MDIDCRIIRRSILLKFGSLFRHASFSHKNCLKSKVEIGRFFLKTYKLYKNARKNMYKKTENIVKQTPQLNSKIKETKEKILKIIEKLY